MGRFRFVVSASLAVVLVCSLFFVPGSFAEPLGAGLLASFGVSSGGSGSTPSTTRGFDLPVTVANTDANPVPVTVQGTAGQPLTATIDGTVDTRESEPAGAQPYQVNVPLNFAINSGIANADTPDIPAGKRLILRYVSGSIRLDSTQHLIDIVVRTYVEGAGISHVIPSTYVATTSDGTAYYQVGTETWIEADAGTDVQIAANRDLGTTATSGFIVLSGYLIDAPATP